MEIEIKFFSQQIRNLREEHHLTQEALAHELGVSRQSIISLERGRCLPSLPLAMSMADLFDLMVEDILRPTERQFEDIPQRLVADLKEQENAWVAQIQLPEYIDHERIEAEIKDGVFTLTFPKKNEPAPKVTKVKVKRG